MLPKALRHFNWLFEMGNHEDTCTLSSKSNKTFLKTRIEGNWRMRFHPTERRGKRRAKPKKNPAESSKRQEHSNWCMESHKTLSNNQLNNIEPLTETALHPNTLRPWQLAADFIYWTKWIQLKSKRAGEKRPSLPEQPQRVQERPRGRSEVLPRTSKNRTSSRPNAGGRRLGKSRKARVFRRSPRPPSVSWNQTRRVVALYDRAQLALVDKEWGCGAGKKRLQILEEISAVVAASLCTVSLYLLPPFQATPSLPPLRKLRSS